MITRTASRAPQHESRITRTALGLAALLLLGIGAISPATYASTPISTCPFNVTASGNYTVTADLTGTGNCILIFASNVAIDLRGHTITGNGTGSGIGAGAIITNIIIANGTIKGFAVGVNLLDYVTVSKVNAIQNADFGIALHSNSTVTNSQARNNGLNGIEFFGGNDTVSNSQGNGNGGAGIASDLGNNTVTNSQANNNVAAGIDFLAGSDTVSNSEANNNNFIGIFLQGGNNTIINSPANNNGNDGIALEGSSNTVTNSPANNNALVGMFIIGGNNAIIGSPANGNQNDGILLVGSGNSLTSDTANNNGDVGITLTCPSNLFSDTAQGNTTANTSSLTGCTLLDNNF